MNPLRSALQAMFRHLALRHGLAVGLWRKFAAPSGLEWAEYLRRHGTLHAIGTHCSIQSSVVITDPTYTRLGNNVRLSGCTLFGHDGVVNMLRQAYGGTLDQVGAIDIRDNVFIGHQAIVMPGVTIGPNAVVAAGAVVTRDVPPGCVVAGVPARTVSTTAELHARLLERTRKLPWWDLLTAREDVDAPADPAIQAWRIRHFFPLDAGGPDHVD